MTRLAQIELGLVNRYVIGVDPGDSTGIAVLCDVSLFWVFQGPPRDALEWFGDVVDALRAHGDDVYAAVERFTRGGRPVGHAALPTPQRVIGAVEALCRESRVPLDFQSPAEAKRLAPNHFLRATGLYVSPRTVGCRDADDANDAVRHAVLLLARRRATTFERLLRPLR